MPEHPLDLSARLIESGVVDTPPNRVTQELSELADGVALVESFSHVLVVDTGDGLVAFDASGPMSGREVVESIRRWFLDRIDTIVTRTDISTTSAARRPSRAMRPSGASRLLASTVLPPVINRRKGAIGPPISPD